MKVGDYVRTKNKIYKIIDKKFDETILVDLFQTDIDGYLMKNDIIKSSPNIIDLIEVGDYVNGYKVLFIDNDLSKTKNIKCIDNEEERQCFYEQDIKSIVTKECFESMEYKVKE